MTDREGANGPPDEQLQALDLTQREPEQNVSPSPGKARIGLYDPSRHREWVRGGIAIALLATLLGTIGAAFWTLWHVKPTADNLKDLLTILYAPLIGIIGTALGFYFGSSEKREK